MIAISTLQRGEDYHLQVPAVFPFEGGTANAIYSGMHTLESHGSDYHLFTTIMPSQNGRAHVHHHLVREGCLESLGGNMLRCHLNGQPLSYIREYQVRPANHLVVQNNEGGIN